MKHSLELEIQTQPTNTSCGPTCLAAVYDYWGSHVDLRELITAIGELESGGTLAVHLACDALARGYDVEMVTYNLQFFDPTWFDADGEMLSRDVMTEKLQAQWTAKRTRRDVDQLRLFNATEAYLQFLSLGGRIRMQPLDEKLIVDTLVRGIPILCGLSATYLYHERRERIEAVDASRVEAIPDDIHGDPSGHFVVLHGYDPSTTSVLIADPLHPNPMAPTNKYAAPLSRLTSAILLGIVTYDANIMTIVPRSDF
ncbi:C39 family peptidase [Allorhodopirellula heiligendammensis]|uniref:Peptidase C39 family protein n=1 Tax=Allorhodopirellula heiligendammensis TaxID=2714739 RepID=A0A5C6C6Q1_9BACT|nr:C39 family peptidase [Allorhodopirellula heiligendammensis]TWU19146.1 Peptidase C39 family protein [Allorhodopirellula heiligendammensis]